MPEKRTKQPFIFAARLHLTELTGLRAANLMQLLKLIKEVPGACIYHHTHRILQQHLYLSPEPPNDFSYWVTEVLGEEELGEMLSSIDTVRFSNIRSLREEIVQTITGYIKKNPIAKLKFARENEEFHFMKSVSFVIPTKYAVYTLKEFVEVLKKINIDSLYFHMFEARMRLEKETNDFSFWLGTSLGETNLAKTIAELDPYTFTLEDLRKKIISIIEKRRIGG